MNSIRRHLPSFWAAAFIPAEFDAPWLRAAAVALVTVAALGAAAAVWFRSSRGAAAEHPPLDAPQRRRLCVLPAATLSGLEEGANLLRVAAAGEPEKEVSIIVHQLRGKRVVCLNRCRHMGGTFVRDIEDMSALTCTLHGWRLNAETLEYTNPPNCATQEELPTEMLPSGAMLVYDEMKLDPWDDKTGRSSSPLPLAAGELSCTYLSHACVLLSAGNVVLATDPWLTGPAFTRGWWLLHEPPQDAIEQVARATALFISHSHSDHLNLPTLERIAKVNPNLPIYAAELRKPVFRKPFPRARLFERAHCTRAYLDPSWRRQGRRGALHDPARQLQ